VLRYIFTTLTFATPAVGAVYVGPTNVELSLATPFEAVDGRITSAEFYAPAGLGVSSVGLAQSAPFSVTLNNLAPNLYVYGAAVSNHVGEVRVVPPVTFSVRPSNDNFSERISLPPIPGHIRGWVGGGSWEPGEKRPVSFFIPNAGSSWWEWTAPETGIYNAQMISLTSILVYRKSNSGSNPDLPSLKSVARFNYGYNQFQAVARETYYLQAFSPARPGKDEVATAIEFLLTR
jgi:hypothetical protein